MSNMKHVERSGAGLLTGALALTLSLVCTVTQASSVKEAQPRESTDMIALSTSETLSVRQQSIVPIAAPTEEERAQPYLWRFWRHLPARGKFTVFDRSWYGRVLVERVEGFCSPADWLRAYSEINDFEEQIADAGVRSNNEVWAAGKGNVTRVRAGPFTTREEAEQARAKLATVGLEGKVAAH